MAFREFALPAQTTNTHRNAAIPVSTAPIERGVLSETIEEVGIPGFRREPRINAAVTGVMTWTSPPGSVVRRGGTLYKVNGEPVRLMYGRIPMYRALKLNDKGEAQELVVFDHRHAHASS